jgi:predicted DNA-binding protein
MARTDEMLTLRIPATEMQRLTEAAAQLGRSRSALIREAIARTLAEVATPAEGTSAA